MFWLRYDLVAAAAVRMWEAFFAFHICIAELLSELLGRAVVQRAVGPLAVVLLTPGLPEYTGRRSASGTRLR